MLLEGGQGSSWRCGDVVLKPADVEGDPTREWLHRIALPAARTELRIAFPLTTRDAALRSEGWEATRWFPGSRPAGRWLERADVVRRFSLALEAVDPAGLPARADPWAVADRAAWGESVGPLAAHPIARALQPVALPVRIVHGDAAGNTLFHERLPPALIDLSLYARPVEWAVAVLAVDLIAFEGASLDLAAEISPESAFPQLLARALLFRMTTDVLRGGTPDPAYEPLADAVLRAIAKPTEGVRPTAVRFRGDR